MARKPKGNHWAYKEQDSLNNYYNEISPVPRRSLLIRCPREVWEREAERTDLGDVTAYGRVQE